MAVGMVRVGWSRSFTGPGCVLTLFLHQLWFTDLIGLVHIQPVTERSHLLSRSRMGGSRSLSRRCWSVYAWDCESVTGEQGPDPSVDRPRVVGISQQLKGPGYLPD